MGEHGITLGHYLFGLDDFLATYGIDPVVAIDALIVSVLLILLAFFGGRKFRTGEMVEPNGRVSLSFLVEYVIQGLYSLFDGIIKHGSAGFFAYLGTLSFFILGNNLIGLIPGFNPPTDQLNVTATLALMTFFVAHFIGIKTHGFTYIKKFLGPVWWLIPLMFPLEVISHLVRPLSLSVRLFGNMTADHMVVAAFGAFILPYIVPIPFMGLGLFVSFVQTFVFVLLSAVYFQDAMEHAH